jgi:5-methylcytosine-specific restriction endonuclease McrA
MRLNQYSRYQSGLSVGDLFPVRGDGTCAYGCGTQLSGRRRKWCSNECRDSALVEYQIIKGDNTVIREELLKRDSGFCRSCGIYDEKWEADHMLPVFKGGGACYLDNLQTLCFTCHKEKSRFWDRVPYSHDVLAFSFNIIPSANNIFRTFDKGICENIERETKLFLNWI